MTEVVLSPERLGRITGSRISAILGLNPYQTRAEVLRDMVRQFHGLPDLFTGNEATEHGHKHEADGIAKYEAQQLQIVHSAQDIVVHPFYDFLAITPDGLVGEDGVVEIKCPWRARYKTIDERPDYEVQCRLQMECTGRIWCDFGVWRPRSFHVSRVDFDPNWLPSVMPRLTAFMAEYEAMKLDPVFEARERGRGVAVEVSERESFLHDRARWKELQAQEDAIGAELIEVKARIAHQLGDNEIATVDGKPAAKWQYRNGPSIFDRASFKAAHADLEAEYSKAGAPTKYPVLIDDTDNEGEAA